jgi:hypothetical protein
LEFQKTSFASAKLQLTIQTMVGANEKIFLAMEIIFPINEKMASGLKAMLIVPNTKDFTTKTIVFVIEKVFSGFETIFSNAETLVEVPETCSRLSKPWYR